MIIFFKFSCKKNERLVCWFILFNVIIVVIVLFFTNIAKESISWVMVVCS
jgi:hypothetical protein